MRIHVIPPAEHLRGHLIAEYVRLPRLFNRMRDAQALGKSPSVLSIPTAFTPNRGHLLFFMDKGMFLLRRYQELVREVRSREIRETNQLYPNDMLNGLEQHWLNDWEPDSMALYLDRLWINNNLRVRGYKT
jgi:deoxyribonuclease (pyrimidine dimer)